MSKFVEMHLLYYLSTIKTQKAYFANDTGKAYTVYMASEQGLHI